MMDLDMIWQNHSFALKQALVCSV